MKIGKITDGWGLEYCVPLEVYVQRHINKIVYLQTADYLRKLYIEQLEKDIAYLTKEINDKLPAKLREVKNKKALLEQRKAYLKSNVDLQIEQIQKLLQQIKDSNKLSFYDTKMYTWNIDTRVVEEQRQAVRAQFWYRNIILEKYQEKKKAEDEEYQRKLRILTNEIKQKMIIIKQDIKDKIAGKEVRKNAEKVANHVAIFSKDDDRLNKVKARHNLFKLYLSLILEKTKEEISKLKQLHGPTLSKTENGHIHTTNLIKYLKLQHPLLMKYKENDKIKVECKRLQLRINIILCHLYKGKIVRILNDLREQKAKAEQEYEDTYTKWDIISEDRATLMGNLHKLTTDNINLAMENMRLQLQIDFCNKHNPILENIARGELGLYYLYNQNDTKC